VPLIVGSAVFDGTAGAAATNVVCAELALVEPPELDAVTATLTVDPTSAATRAYVCAVAPAMSLQVAPDESQRRHWYAYGICAVPDHEPAEAVNATPACGVPLIVGRLVFAGETSLVVCTTSCGAADPVERLLIVIPVELVVVTATLIEPFPVTSGVMLTDENWPLVNAPDEPVIVPDGAGAFWYVIVVSPQVLLATLRAS